MTASLLRTDTRTIVYDSDADTTVENDVLGGPGNVHRVIVNSGEDDNVFIHLFDHKAPTLGTTDAEVMLRCEGDTDNPLNEGVTAVELNPPDGVPFATAVSYACSTAAAGTGAPSPAVLVTLECST